MATEKLQIVLDAVYRGKSAIREAQSDLSSLNKRAGGIRETLGDLGGAGAEFGKKLAVGAGVAGVAIGALAVGAQQAFRVIGEGAELTKARDQFDRLAVSINSTGDAMLGKLKEATSGLMTDAELVANAGKIMSMGLQDTEDGVVRLAAVAGELGWDMSQVILTMANDSTMRLDALSLSIEDVTSKAAKLKAAGMDASSAFDLAVIQAGEEKVALVGKAADTTAGKVKIMETMWRNATGAFQIAFADSATSQLSDVTVSAYQAGDGFKYAAEWWGNLIGTITGAPLGLLDFEAAANKAKALGIEGVPGYGGKFPLITTDQAALERRVYGFLRGYNARMGATRGTNANYSSGRAGGAISSSSMFDYSAVATDRTTNFRGMGATDPRTSALWREYERYAGVQGVLQTQGLKTAQVLREQEAALTGGGGSGGGGLASALRDSAEAMAMLSAESGDLFSRLRGAKEFNLAEELFSLGDKMGAGALDLAQFGVTAGLFDQNRADELLGQSFLLQNAEQMLAAGMSLQEVWSAVSGQQANASALATEFFSTIDQTSAEATMLLDTDPSYSALEDFISAVESANPVMNIVPSFGGYGGEPVLGGGGSTSGVPIQSSGTAGGGAAPIIINNYGGEAVATQAALIARQRSVAQDVLLGRS